MKQDSSGYVKLKQNGQGVGAIIILPTHPPFYMDVKENWRKEGQTRKEMNKQETPVLQNDLAKKEGG